MNFPAEEPVEHPGSGIGWKTWPRARVALLALVILFGLLICAHDAFLLSDPDRDRDFAVFYAAGQVAAAGNNPYDLEAVGRRLNALRVHTGIQEYLYSSSFLILMQPLDSLSLRTAHRIFELFIYLAVAASLTLIWLALRETSRRRALPWLLALLLVWFTPLWSNIALTQVNGLVLLLLSTSFFLTIRRRDFWAGLALAGAMAIKFTPALLLAYYLFARRWRALAGALTGVAVLEGASALLFGGFLDANLPGALMDQGSRKLFYWNNLSLPAVLARPLGSGSAWVEPLALAIGAAIGVLTLMAAWRRRGDVWAAGPVFGLLVTAFLLMPMYLYGDHLLLLLIPLGVIIALLTGPLATAGRALLAPTLACLVLSFLLIELDYWRVWQFLDMERWGLWAHPAAAGLLLLWGLQLVMLTRPAFTKRLRREGWGTG